MKSDVTLKTVTLDSFCPAGQIKHSLAQATGKDNEWEAALDDPQWFLQPQDSAPMCHNQMFLQKNQSIFFPVLICTAMAFRIPINYVLRLTWIFHQPGVCSHPHSLWGLLGAPFPKYTKATQSPGMTWYSFPIQMPYRSIHLYHQALDGISPKLIIWRSVCGFFGQHFNLKNVNQSKDEQYNEYYMPTTSILPLTFYCSCLVTKPSICRTIHYSVLFF